MGTAHPSQEPLQSFQKLQEEQEEEEEEVPHAPAPDVDKKSDQEK